MAESNIDIYMLGKFAIAVDGKIVLEDEGKVHKLWTFLGYLITNRKRTISQAELVDLLCGDDRSKEPLKAIKNLAYRLRKLLGDASLPHADYILQKSGAYFWNNDIDIKVDVEEFLGHYELAKQYEDDPEEALKHYRRAIDAYGGGFLPRAEYDEWAAEFMVYYHRIFMECVLRTFKLLQKSEKLEDMLPICEKAISFDKYAEKVYIMYIYCLDKLGYQQAAIKEYETITNRLYDELGVNPSKQLKRLYREITNKVNGVETDLSIIKEELNEEEGAHKSYYCDYNVFQNIYRFAARRVSRTGEPFYLVLCTMSSPKGSELDVKVLKQAMEEFKESIGSTLRKGDVYSRYSVSQYVIMLPTLSYENGLRVVDRIKRSYRDRSSSHKVNVHYKLQQIDHQGL